MNYKIEIPREKISLFSLSINETSSILDNLIIFLDLNTILWQKMIF